MEQAQYFALVVENKNNIKEEVIMGTSSAFQKLFFSLVLFALGFFLGYKFMAQSISVGIIIGWGFGGVIWGWFLVRKWVPPNPHADSSSMLGVIMFGFRLMASIAVGLIAMPLTLIQFIISLVMAKRKRDAAIARNTENEQGT
jgi:hypothetical protein